MALRQLVPKITEPGEAEAAEDRPSGGQPSEFGQRPAGRDVWLTKDGRELTIGEMYRPHLGNAQAVISKWLKREKDPLKRRELKSWRSRMRCELVKREKAWQKKRKKEAEAEEGSGGGVRVTNGSIRGGRRHDRD